MTCMRAQLGQLQNLHREQTDFLNKLTGGNHGNHGNPTPAPTQTSTGLGGTGRENKEKEEKEKDVEVALEPAVVSSDSAAERTHDQPVSKQEGAVKVEKNTESTESELSSPPIQDRKF